MHPRFDTVSFLSDFGHADEFVGIVHAVIRTIAPHASIIDLVHDLAPHDVRAGSLALVRCVQYIPPGVVLAVVDPGVGSERRAIAVEVDGGSVLIGPDNGLLAPAVSMCGGALRAVELTAADYQLPAPGPTFAGRDVFAPAAAHLCNGVALTDLGPALDTHSLIPALVPIPREEGTAIHAEVLWVDRYGNCQLNVDPDQLASIGDRVALQLPDQQRTGVLAPTYADIKPGEIGLVVDSYGLVSLAVERHSAAAELRLQSGSPVVLDVPD